MMTTRQSITTLARLLKDEPVVATTGFTSRDLQACADRPGNFYMIGSMGLASSVGLGVALVHPDRKVVVFDGDGSVLMGLGALATIASLRPENLVHVVFDNEVFASTGNQPTYSGSVPLDALASAAGYPVVRRVEKEEDLEKTWREVCGLKGPVFLLVKCRPDSGKPSERVWLEPEEMTARFMEEVHAA